MLPNLLVLCVIVLSLTGGWKELKQTLLLIPIALLLLGLAWHACFGGGP
jgi:hypothetical protein